MRICGSSRSSSGPMSMGAEIGGSACAVDAEIQPGERGFGFRVTLVVDVERLGAGPTMSHGEDGGRATPARSRRE